LKLQNVDEVRPEEPPEVGAEGHEAARLVSAAVLPEADEDEVLELGEVPPAVGVALALVEEEAVVEGEEVFKVVAVEVDFNRTKSRSELVKQLLYLLQNFYTRCNYQWLVKW
jgi:hypothetical protein